MTQRELYEEELRRATEELLELLKRIDPNESATVYLDKTYSAGVVDASIAVDVPVDELLNALEAYKNGETGMIEVDGYQFDLARIKSVSYNDAVLYERERFLDMERIQSFMSHEVPRNHRLRDEECHEAERERRRNIERDRER